MPRLSQWTMLRKLLIALPLCLGVSAADAAETLSAAVDEIAQTIVRSRSDTDAPIRVAVNVFAHPDRRTSMLSNQMMIALTGRLVELGGKQLKVIERAQLESALSELELANVPIFDATTAKDLGNFLGVDALIVGEMSSLTDLVRVHARMISVDTVETMVSASTWIPLTPTIQRMVETDVQVMRPVISDAKAPDLRTGVWKGSGTCGDLTFGMAVAMVFNADGTITAMQSYYPLSGAQGLASGTLEMEGTLDANTQMVSLDPGTWLHKPDGHSAIGFSGKLNVDRGTFEGKYKHEGCGVVELRRLR